MPTNSSQPAARFVPGNARHRTAVTRIRHRVRYLLPTGLLVVTLSGGGFAALETGTVRSYADGVWWALSLVTTVGFADHDPETAVGRVLAGGLMVFGFALLALTTAAVASIFVHEDQAPRDRRDADFEAQLLTELRALGTRLEALERSVCPATGTDPASGPQT